MNAVLESKDPCARSGMPAQQFTKLSQPGMSPTQDMIARRAYEIWQRHGCPGGTSYHDWLAAEAELRCCRR